MTNCTQNCSASIATHQVGIFDALTQVARQWIMDQQLRISIKRERASLLTMSDAMLKDIGIDRAEAEQEAQRSDIPVNR